MKKYITEFIGTFFLTLTVGLTVISPGAGVLAPIAIGAVLMVMVYAGGHRSGAHYNPAVSFAVLISGGISAIDFIGYLIAQLLAATWAGFMTYSLKPDSIRIPASFPSESALIAEIIFTFALAYVVLNVAAAKNNKNNFFYGLAIGSTVMVGAFAVGNISGGVFNPAVGLGVVVMQLMHASDIWIYSFVGMVAAGVAGVLFNALERD